MDFEAKVFDSRLNSCIMKSSLRPHEPPFFSTSRASLT
ncbi:Uncharacterised protein [Vibrio cholerae]|nr:Uncharacterised protein [Vibrio cholerae]